MATTPLLYLNQYFTTILNVGGGIDASQTTGIVVQAVTGLDITKPGIACITYSNPIDTSVAEWVKYTSINGSNELQGVTRGTEGFSAKTHLNQAVIAFPLSESHINNLNAMFDSTGLDVKQIATPASPDSGRNKLFFKTDDLPYALTSGGAEYVIGGSSFLSRQAIINGNFVVNQRVYVSNATLASGAYGHDRWKGGASGGDYTFTQLPSSTTITIKTGKSLIQVIETFNVIGGTYTLSWTGTAQARFGIDSATPSGAYAASPITITTQTAGTVMSVEFNEGTLGKAQLNSGSVALPFQPKSYAEEEINCKKYYQVYGGLNAYDRLPVFGIIASSATASEGILQHEVEMRAKPTFAYTGTIGNFRLISGSSAVAVTAMSTNSSQSNSKLTNVTITAASGLTDTRAYILRPENDIACTLTLSAEL